MKARTLICAVLSLYSVGAIAYAVSELYGARAGCGGGCFKGELPFADGSTGTRTVNVQYREGSGPEGFGTDSSKIAGALNSAIGNWNTATDGTSTTPYQFQSAQGASSPNLQIVLVDDIKGAPRNACMQLVTTANGQTGVVQSGILYVKRSTFNNCTQDQLAELLQHELGHFIGLADFYGNAEQCQTIMAQAKDDCAGLKGSRQISSNDVATVKKYVAHSTDCKQKRGRTSVVTGGGGYTDPNPIPSYYPYTCYYYYSAYDIYYQCDCRENGQYAFTVYVLDDVICY